MGSKIRPNRVFLALLIAEIIFLFALFNPGFMSPDSIFQLNTANAGQYNDWHPPVMGVVWKISNTLFGYPHGMLTLQLAMLGLILFLVNSRFKVQGVRQFFVLLVPVLPWVINFVGVVWKDVHMTLALVAAFLILTNNRKPSFLEKVFALLFLFYAVAMRHNAVFAVFPLLYFLFFNSANIIARSLAAGALTVGLFLLNNFLVYEVLGAQKTNILNYIFADDLTYFSLKYGYSLIPTLTYDEIKYCSDMVVGGTKLIARDFCYTPILDAHDKIYKVSLFKPWLDVIFQHPFDYLSFRSRVFLEFLRLPDLPPYYIWHDGISENAIGLKLANDVGVRVLGTWVNRTAEILPIMFIPITWMFLGAASLVFGYCFARKKLRAILPLVLSAEFYTIGFFPIMNMYDFRYAYYLIFSVIVSTFVFLNSKST